MAPLRLGAIAFDLDGTLYPNSQVLWPSLGLALTHPRLLLALEGARRDLRSRGPVQDFHGEQASLVAQRLNITPQTALKLIEEKIYTEWFRNFSRFTVFEGVRPLLEQCRRWGLKTAVMSDFPIRQRLRDLGLGDLWNLTFSSEEVGALKPDPLCFQELCRRLELPPSAILYVGNDYRYDVVGAKDSGLWAAHLTRKPKPQSRADFSFAHYSELLEWLKGSFL